MARYEHGVTHESVADTDRDDAGVVGVGVPHERHPLNDPANGLLRWYPLHTHTGGGGTAPDLAGGSDGAVTGTTKVPGVRGFPAREFDGSGEYVDISGISQTTTGTVVCYVYESSGSSDNGVVGLNVNNEVDLRADYSTTGGIAAKVNGTTFGGTTLNDEEWYLLGVTWDGSTARLYVDATEEHSAAASGMSAKGEGAHIGRRSNVSTYEAYHAGGIAGVRIYDRALSASEMETLAAWGGMA